MKALPFSITWLPGLLAGIVIGRWLQPRTAPEPSQPAPPGAPTLGKSHPPADFRSLLNQTHSLRGRTALLVGHLSDHPQGSMRQWIEASRNNLRQLVLLSDIALTTDPAGFITALTQINPPTTFYPGVASDFLERWAKLDFDAAFKTCRALPDPMGYHLGGAVLATRLKTDPVGVLQLAAAHPEAALFADNPPDIPPTPENLALVKALPSNLGKAKITAAVSATLPPDEAFALVLGDTHANPMYGLPYVSNVLVKKDPQAAQEWLLADPEHPAAARMTWAMGRHLLDTDPAAAVEWAAAHLSGPSRTSILEKAASALQKTEPAAADAARDLLPTSFKSSGKP